MKNLYLFSALLLHQLVYCQFGPAIAIDSEFGVSEIITTDVNNDGLIDILTSQVNGRLKFYSNLGNGNFSENTIIYDMINRPYSLATGDFNNDGWQDIVAASGQLPDGDLYLFLNDLGSFNTQTIIDTGLFFSQKIRVADVDNDDDEDIILATDTDLIVYYNHQGNVTRVVIEPGITTEFYTLELGDIDNDGFTDIVAGGGGVLIYKNNNGTFSYDSTLTNVIPDNLPLVFTSHLNDFNNDSLLDLIKVDESANKLVMYTNNGTGNFSIISTIDIDVLQIESITSNDFDNDGDIDLITGLTQLGQIVLYNNDGTGNFSDRIIVAQTTIPFSREVYSSDLDNDNFPDIIWSDPLNIHLNTNGILGIQEIESNKDFILYPNPTRNYFYLKNIECESFKLIDLNGRVVLNSKCHSERERINIPEHLQSGIYFLHLFNHEAKDIKKLIIDK